MEVLTQMEQALQEKVAVATSIFWGMVTIAIPYLTFISWSTTKHCKNVTNFYKIVGHGTMHISLNCCKTNCNLKIMVVE